MVEQFLINKHSFLFTEPDYSFQRSDQRTDDNNRKPQPDQLIETSINFRGGFEQEPKTASKSDNEAVGQTIRASMQRLGQILQPLQLKQLGQPLRHATGYGRLSTSEPEIDSIKYHHRQLKRPTSRFRQRGSNSNVAWKKRPKLQ